MWYLHKVFKKFGNILLYAPCTLTLSIFMLKVDIIKRKISKCGKKIKRCIIVFKIVLLPIHNIVINYVPVE